MSQMKIDFLCICFFGFMFLIFMANGQTFQYSRGWTNGKRAYDDTDKNRILTTGISPIPLYGHISINTPHQQQGLSIAKTKTLEELPKTLGERLFSFAQHLGTNKIPTKEEEYDRMEKIKTEMQDFMRQTTLLMNDLVSFLNQRKK